MSEIYQEQLYNQLVELEQCYRVDHRLGIVEIIKSLQSATDDTRDGGKSLETRSAEKLAVICYLNSRIRYFNYDVFNLDTYPCLNRIANILFNFVRASTVTESAIVAANHLITVMRILETSTNLKETISYRYLRLFVVCICKAHYFNASIIAELFIGQMKGGTEQT